MTTATVNDKNQKPPLDYDPDSYRMTIGEHLEDLRWRMILGLLGFAAAIFICVLFTERLIVFFCALLTVQMVKHNLPPSMVYTQITEAFMTYLRIWLISAAALAGPWMLYQLWQFVAAGLYPNERKIVTKYIPLSLTLLIAGMVFVYVVVLPLSIGFFLQFSGDLPLPSPIPSGPKSIVGSYHQFKLPVLKGDPAGPEEGELWINSTEGRVKAMIGSGIRVLMSGGNNLLTPMISISDYIDLVLVFMLTFGLAFQLPLVVLAVVAAGLVEISFLKKQRKTVYFVMAIAAAFLAPGEIVTSMLSLLIPLMILYEFGLWLARFNAPKGSEPSDDVTL